MRNYTTYADTVAVDIADNATEPVTELQKMLQEVASIERGLLHARTNATHANTVLAKSEQDFRAASKRLRQLLDEVENPVKAAEGNPWSNE